VRKKWDKTKTKKKGDKKSKLKEEIFLDIDEMVHNNLELVRQTIL
jgi:hypothetical protein